MRGIEQRYAGLLEVIRINVLDTVGPEMLSRHRVASVPTFILFGAEGELHWRRSGYLNPEELHPFLSDDANPADTR